MDLNLDKKIDDIVPLLRSIWTDRRRLVRNCVIAVVVGLIVAFSIPREYESIVVLAPESSQGSSLSGLSSLASMAGVNVGNLSAEDALYPELYPQITGSTTFLSDLYSMEVTSGDGEIKTTLFDYIANKQSKPWWEYILALPARLK
ncbi:MAG: chain-length determining protein, partial [Bacteroidaceae bacterium]|nr:chain-length determining protein [Bacteroidaceae bacterium]